MSIGLFFMILMPITDIIYYLYLLKILAHIYKIPEREPYGNYLYRGSIFIFCLAWISPSLLSYPFFVFSSSILSAFAHYLLPVIELIILVAVLCLHKSRDAMTRMSSINILILISFFSFPYWLPLLGFYSDLGFPLQIVSNFAIIGLFECSSLILLQMMNKKGLFSPSKRFM